MAVYKDGDNVLVKFHGKSIRGVIQRIRPLEFQPFPDEVTYSVDFPHLKYENKITKIIKEDEIISLTD